MATIARLQRMNRGTHFRALTLRGGDFAEPIDPFIGVDHAWISAPTFPPHPHAGLSAVSYLFLDSETGIDNRDSLGNRNHIEPGGLHWTAAGQGVVHDEVPAQLGKTVHMLQMFVNLAANKQNSAPFAMSLPSQEVPVVQLSGAKIRVVLGSYGETRSPLEPPAEIGLLDISINDGEELSVPVVPQHSAFVMPVYGTLSIDGVRFDSGEPRLPVFEPQPTGRTIRIRALDGNAKAVIFSGLPLRQPVHWSGPMAMATLKSLDRAIDAYHRGEFGQL